MRNVEIIEIGEVKEMNGIKRLTENIGRGRYKCIVNANTFIQAIITVNIIIYSLLYYLNIIALGLEVQQQQQQTLVLKWE